MQIDGRNGPVASHYQSNQPTDIPLQKLGRFIYVLQTSGKTVESSKVLKVAIDIQKAVRGYRETMEGSEAQNSLSIFTNRAGETREVGLWEEEKEKVAIALNDTKAEVLLGRESVGKASSWVEKIANLFRSLFGGETEKKKMEEIGLWQQGLPIMEEVLEVVDKDYNISSSNPESDNFLVEEQGYVDDEESGNDIEGRDVGGP